MEPNEYTATPQVPRSQYWSGYDSGRRWSSYWIQIEHALATQGRILEIGVGNGLVSEYLGRIGTRDVTTLDIDPELCPDIVGDISHLPFEDSTFECVMACEVLEHMPFDRSAKALKEMRRVASKGIVSVPNSSRCVQFTVSTRDRSRPIRVSFPWFRRVVPPKEIKEHHWELEMKGFPESRFREMVQSAGWRITGDIRNPSNLYHHFFFLERDE